MSVSIDNFEEPLRQIDSPRTVSHDAAKKRERRRGPENAA
jgi:hypothetical protein